MLAEIPSAYDLYAGGSPKSRSAASSDSGLSSGRSSANEIKHRFEKLPNGGHRHRLSAPKRHQFLANQVRRLRDFLDSRKERDKEKEKEKEEEKEKEKEKEKEGHGHHHDKNGNGNGNGDGHDHHISRELLEHPLSLLAEKIEDFEADHHINNNAKKKHNVKDDFIHKYGDLQHVVGRGE